MDVPPTAAMLVFFLLVSGCSEPPTTAIDDSTFGDDVPSAAIARPEDVRREGDWVLSIPSVATDNAERIELTIEQPIAAKLLIRVDRPSILAYQVRGPDGSIVAQGMSDVTVEWTVPLDFKLGDHEVWASMRTGGPTHYEVELTFDRNS